MMTLSAEALLVAIRSIIRDQARMEQALGELDSSSDAAAEIGDDVLQAIKILGEINDVYEEIRKTQPHYPSFEEIRKSSFTSSLD
jgi:hypothetical protein